MHRRSRGGVLGLALAWAAAPVGAEEEPPPLVPPIEVPRPPAEAPESIPREDRPILVVPGLPTPRRSAARPAVPRLAPAVPDPAPEPLPDAPPPLVAPADLGESAEPASPLPRYSPEPLYRPGAGRALSLEPAPADGIDPLKPSPRPRPEGAPAADPGPRPTASPRRGLLGLFPRPAASNRPPAEDPIRVEPRSDPAADAALKRRIETQVRRAAGDKLRSVEVRVKDRQVYVLARVGRFWQKRGVRRTIETLPALSGYKTVVDVVE